MVEVTEAELDRLVERLERGGFHPYEGRHIPDDLTDEAAAAITALRARIAEDQARIAALTTYRENLRDEVIELRARIAELEACIDLVIPDDCKSQLHEDATNMVKLQARVAELEAERAEWVGEREESIRRGARRTPGRFRL